MAKAENDNDIVTYTHDKLKRFAARGSKAYQNHLKGLAATEGSPVSTPAPKAETPKVETPKA